jgi:hypothetical protein
MSRPRLVMRCDLIDYDTLPCQLRSVIPGFDRVYDEHVADYDKVLPHVLVADLVRFLGDEVRRHGAQSAVLRQAMELLELAMGSHDPRVEELLSVSFVENLDPEDPSVAAIRSTFGPKLEELYRLHEVWWAERA